MDATSSTDVHDARIVEADLVLHPDGARVMHVLKVFEDGTCAHCAWFETTRRCVGTFRTDLLHVLVPCPQRKAGSRRLVPRG